MKTLYRTPLLKTLVTPILFATAPLTLAANSVVDQLQLGTKYSSLKQITKDNVTQLGVAWEYHTGDGREPKPGSLTSFQDQPSLIEGNLVVCSTNRRVIALDPKTGEERWVFDPKDPETGMKKCRGVGNWVDSQAEAGAVCQSRIFLGTANYRLFAIDAKTGKPCPGFGNNGEVIMPVEKPQIFTGEVLANSRPAIVNDVVVVGSVVADNQRIEAPSGRVLAFDARSGEQLWSFDPLPRDPSDPAMKTWLKGSVGEFGAGNVWATMSVDQELDMVYLPTSSASGDFYGAGRPGNNEYTSSVVALKGTTGEVVWHQQLVHHNVFDYDVPSQPLLLDFPHKGKLVPALVQNTKMGLIFVFDRKTGEPLIPIEERPVPQEGKVEGEWLSPTQPFPVGIPNIMPLGFTPDDVWGFTPLDEWLCRRKTESLLYGDIYTPASLKGTIFNPSVGGGPNWGGGGYDPATNIMVVPSNRIPTIVTLVPREQAEFKEGQAIEATSEMIFPVEGSPYVPKVQGLLSIFGAPCSKPPWAALTAVNMATKEIAWEVPLGSVDKMSPFPMPWDLGMPGAGGPLVTAGGLIFIGYSLDDTMKAFDLNSGELLWEGDLPAAGTSVPISYEWEGEQYIIIPAGGHSMYNSTMGDSVMAFKLKR
ncbi:MAG: pyrroloquinoline quinone-dependent dehydrogenase [Pseudomonadota bacterium]|nr:pyrroloquinoline quinone-dependent dehydrogenase [Pseudomonadota bacterium]